MDDKTLSTIVKVLALLNVVFAALTFFVGLYLLTVACSATAVGIYAAERLTRRFVKN